MIVGILLWKTTFLVNSEDGVVALSVFIDHFTRGDVLDPMLWCQFEDEGDYEWGKSNTNASSKSTAVEWRGTYNAREVVGHDDLPGESTGNNGKEEVVVGKLLKNIKVTSSDLSAVDFIEDLEEHKSVENVGQVKKLVLALFV